ncbi:MAG: hypothetical protein LBI06_04025, partial [Treponema sp.]|nr:hypothetical protein [Treponema sp.]
LARAAGVPEIFYSPAARPLNLLKQVCLILHTVGFIWGYGVLTLRRDTAYAVQRLPPHRGLYCIMGQV